MKLLRKIGRAVRYFFQRRKRGFDDSELYSLDVTIADFILPRLKRFKEIQNSHPNELTDEQWNEKISMMISAFEFVQSDAYFGSTKDETQPGLQAFSDYFGHLWL